MTALTVVNTNFSKFLFSLESLNFISLATNTASCFPWSDRFILFVFEKLSTKYPSLNSHSLSVVSSKNGIPWKEQPVQLTMQTITHMLHKITVLCCSVEVLYAHFPFIIQSMKMCTPVGWNLMKLFLQLHPGHS